MIPLTRNEIAPPLLANIALSALDEHLHGPWKPGGTMSTEGKRVYPRRKGSPTWRLVRYADDFVVLVHGTEHDTQALREDIAEVLAPLRLRLSEAKTQVVDMADGFDFLGFRIQWRRKRGDLGLPRGHAVGIPATSKPEGTSSRRGTRCSRRSPTQSPSYSTPCGARSATTSTPTSSPSWSTSQTRASR
ncbi:MAG: reverse transcriptase domain-containing protein [Streptomycetales bacterium]